MKNAFKLLLITAVTSVTFAACSGGNKGSESDTSSSTMSDTATTGGSMSADSTGNMGGMSDTTSRTDTGARM